jgi:hypothetical protein
MKIMKQITSLRLRKCSDINMDLPFFEALDEAGEIVMDISESDDGDRVVLFHPGSVGKTISVDLMNRMLKEAGELIDNEKL